MTGSNESTDERPVWKRTSDYSWKCGGYRLSWTSVAGVVGYALYHEWEWLGWHETAAKARQVAKRHSEGKR